MSKSALALLGSPLLVAVVGGMAAAGPHVDAAGVLIRDEHSCGTRQQPSAVASNLPFSAPTTRTIYLNKNGGTYNIGNGATNSATNAANVIAAGDGRAHANAVIPPIEASFDWPYIVACVKQQYAPYNVIVTETEPTSGSYVEAVVGGTGASTGWSATSGILGVASADNFCGVTEKGIAFSFSSNHVGIAKANDELCATIAHEVGHLLSLEHEVTSKDTMSYVPFATAGSKSFTDGNGNCGTQPSQPTPCSCPTSGSGEVTDSSLRLGQYLGMRPMETVPPTLEVTSPGDGKTVPPAFSVTADATDNTAMDQVAVLVDDTMMGASTTPEGATYTIALAHVAEGNHTLQVRAVDLAGNVTTRSLAIKVALLQTGDTCASNDQCKGTICATGESGTFCSQACDATDNGCPSDFSCEAVGESHVCVPSSGGGCSTTTGDGRPLVLLAGLALGMAVVRRRSAR
jgi:hypothetical protein